MRFGVREICNVMFKARAKMTVGTKTFFKGEPVILFDSLKTSTIEGAATTVYAQGGRGNARLVAWDGERTVTFTMEDALISTESLAILTGAGVTEATSAKPMSVHTTAYATGKAGTWTTELPANTVIDADKQAYMIILDRDGSSFKSEPYLVSVETSGAITISDVEDYTTEELPKEDGVALVDFYVKKTEGAYTMSIKADSFGGNFYIEADTLFRDEASGLDMPAEFIIPNGKVQSNFTFSMASSGDPSTFTFTVDAFPARVNGGTEKVYCDIQVIYDDVDNAEDTRTATPFVK